MTSEFIRLENIAIALSSLLYKSFYGLEESKQVDGMERLRTLCLTLIDTSKTLDKELGERFSVLFHNIVVAIHHNQKPFTDQTAPSWIKRMLIRNRGEDENTPVEQLLRNAYIVAVRDRIQRIFDTPVFLSDGKRTAKVSASPISKLHRDDILDPLFYVLPILEKDIRTPIFESPTEYILEAEKLEYERYESMIESFSELDLFDHIDILLDATLRDIEDTREQAEEEFDEEEDQSEEDEEFDEEEDQVEEGRIVASEDDPTSGQSNFGEIYADMFNGVEFNEDDFDDTLLGEEFDPYKEISKKEEVKEFSESDMRNIEALVNLMKLDMDE